MRRTEMRLRLKSGLEQQALIYPYLTPDAAKITVNEGGFKELVISLINDNSYAGGLYSSINMVVQSALQVRELLSMTACALSKA